MILRMMHRLKSKISRLWFACFHAPALYGCGPRSHLYAPFRLDGHEHISLGADSVCQKGAWLYCRPVEGTTAQLKIGDGCVFGYNSHLTAVKDLVIENHVLLANNVYITDCLHDYEDIHTPVMRQGVRFKQSVVIGQGSWIGENACIIGARIGRNCVVGANAVVTHDVPDYSVVVGAPARIIRQYDAELGEWVSTSDL